MIRWTIAAALFGLACDQCQGGGKRGGKRGGGCSGYHGSSYDGCYGSGHHGGYGCHGSHYGSAGGYGGSGHAIYTQPMHGGHVQTGAMMGGPADADMSMGTMQIQQAQHQQPMYMTQPQGYQVQQTYHVQPGAVIRPGHQQGLYPNGQWQPGPNIQGVQGQPGVQVHGGVSVQPSGTQQQGGVIVQPPSVQHRDSRLPPPAPTPTDRSDR